MEEEGNTWLHSTEDLSNWSSHLLIDDGSALTYSMATDNDEIIVTVGGILGSQTCMGSTPDSMNCESDSTERRDLFMHANSTWFVEGQSLHQLDDGISTPAWELGLHNGTILAYSNDALWVENAGLWVWNGSEFESLEIPFPLLQISDNAALSLNAGRLIVTTGNGVAILDGDNTSGVCLHESRSILLTESHSRSSVVLAAT